jgi:uncharacterized protein (DUF305 family)
MYVLMYAMLNTFGNVYANLNQFYMAGLMTASMVIIELAVMGEMYEARRLKLAVMAVGLVALIGFFAFIRYQVGITDRQFMRSMIPHHAGAILMCREAMLTDEELANLCRSISEGQRREIEQMNAIRARLDQAQ